jgi:hypothetical protein
MITPPPLVLSSDNDLAAKNKSLSTTKRHLWRMGDGVVYNPLQHVASSGSARYVKGWGFIWSYAGYGRFL